MEKGLDPCNPSTPSDSVSRNAARARSKDTTGRVQRSHFSRQRLDILSKGLGGLIPSGETSSGCGPRVTASDIALSHAKHLEVLEDQNGGFIPHPHIPSKSHKRSSSGSRTSRVLEALDTTERTSLEFCLPI